MTGLERHQINEHALLGVLRRENVVVQRALIKIHGGGGRLPFKQMAGELEHIIRVAGLRRLGRKVFVKIIGGKEMLAVAVPANDVRTIQGDALPEKFGDVFVARVSRQFILPRRADHLRNLCIGVKSVKAILLSRQRIEKPFLIKRLGDS